MNIKRLKGTEDILPEQAQLWNTIEQASRRIFGLYGYREIRTPIIEEKSLFIRSVGEDTDIIKKQMYSFKDQGERDICLRPEETASVVRAYLENHLDKEGGFVKLYYMGPMFRSEKPQAGRLRQFHQIGVEAIGSYSPYLDVEVIILLDELLKAYGLSGYKIKLNNLGCQKDREKLKEMLKAELKDRLGKLCDDCKRRYNTNILRVLDCKNPACEMALDDLTIGVWCKDCTAGFNMLLKLLDESAIRYERSGSLVRGLDYYTNTVFEVVTDKPGQQNAVAAGGRYDNLIPDFGGPKTGSCGFAIGIERVIEALANADIKPTQPKGDIVFIATLGEEAYKEGFKMLADLRRSGISSDIDYQAKSLKAQMRYADKLNARYVVIIGDDELKNKAAVVKNMQNGTQKTVALDKLATELMAHENA